MKTFRAWVILVGVSAFLAAPLTTSAQKLPRPVSAQIINAHGKLQSEDAVGNVEVCLSNGRREVWTLSGHCEQAKVSSTGLMGWTYADEQHSKGAWMNNELIIARSKNDRVHLQAAYAFIEVWAFTDQDMIVITRSRHAHGISIIQRFQIATGEMLDQCSGSETKEDTPEWARPFRDEE